VTTSFADDPLVVEVEPGVFEAPSRPQKFRKVRGLIPEEWVEYAIALVGGVHLALLLRFLLDWDDLLGTALVALGSFVLFHFVIVRERSTPEVATDKAVTTLMWTIGAGIVVILGWMVAYVAIQGAKEISLSFFREDLSTVGALDAGGGAYHAIIGTFQQVGMATVVVVPIAILTAVYLHEIQGRMSTVIRFIVDALSGLPSIVAGLLIYTIIPGGYAGYKASLALFILALPIVTRTAEEVLRTVPDGLREASLALGAPQWRVVMKVVLPTARAGLVTAVLLAVARITGETAPVLLTALGSANTNYNPFDGPQASLPLFVWDLIRVPDKLQNDRAWAGALILLILVLIAFVAARFTLARSERKLGRR
jgi:phosphate transport system permease protein